MEAKWNQLVEDLAEGRLPFVEAMMSASKAMVQPGDYRAYINHHRSFTMLMSDPRILRRMHQELMAKLTSSRRANSTSGPRSGPFVRRTASGSSASSLMMCTTRYTERA